MFKKGLISLLILEVYIFLVSPYISNDLVDEMIYVGIYIFTIFLIRRSTHIINKRLNKRYITVKIIIYLALAFIFQIMTINIQNYLMYYLNIEIPYIDSTQSDFIENMNLLSVFQVLIIAPIYEELIFRYLLIDGNKYKKLVLPIFSSAVFSLYHLDIFLLPYFTIGMFFCYIMKKEGNIYLVTITHILMNTITFFLMGKA